MSGEARKKFQMTDLAMPINLFFIKHALKSVPGLADVGVLHGDSPELHPDVWGGSEKSFK